jgi:hypothetical protein
MRDLDLPDLPAGDDLLDSALQALRGETTYLWLDGQRIAAIVPVYVAEEHDEDIDAAVARAADELAADLAP